MADAATTATTIVTSPSVTPLTTIDNLFLLSHQLFDQYRTSIFVLTGTFVAGWLYNKFWINRKFYSSTQSMQGKTVLITGGNAGIGYETAKDLLKRGARVVLFCRNMDKGRQAVQELLSETGCTEKNLRLMKCDLSSFDSIHKAAEVYNAEEDRLDVLICNAGVAWSPNIVTKDGFNDVIQANYLGHFLLTHLLLDKLKKCRPSRIVNVSSGAHRKLRAIDWDDVFTQFKTTGFLGTYGPSKGFQILSTCSLKQKLLGEGINTFALHPGWVWTSIQAPMREAIGFYSFIIFYPILKFIKFFLAKNSKTGAETTIYCAIEPSLEHSSDIYFKNCAPKKPIPLCTDEATAEHLWELSLEAVGLK